MTDDAFDDGPTIPTVGALPEAVVDDDVTQVCEYLSDVLRCAVNIEHERDLVDFLVLERFDRRSAR